MIDWVKIRNLARATSGKPPREEPPSSAWKRRILLAEHSPIRSATLTIELRGIPYWVSVHLSRHKIGVEHFVTSQRSDRTGEPRDEKPQNAPVNHVMVLNPQAFISISRKRLCGKAHVKTVAAWAKVVNELRGSEPELAGCCVPECIYRGFCPELDSCGFCKTSAYANWLKCYRSAAKGDQECR